MLEFIFIKNVLYHYKNNIGNPRGETPITILPPSPVRFYTLVICSYPRASLHKS